MSRKKPKARGSSAPSATRASATSASSSPVRPSTSATSASTSASTSSPRSASNEETDGRVRLPKPVEIKAFLDEYVIGQDAAKKNLAVAVYNHYKRNEMAARRRNDVELQKSNILLIGPTGYGQDAAGPDARAPALGPVRDRRRHDADRGRLRRRGRREHHPQAAAGRGQRRREVPARDHLHRRGGQDRAQGREPVDHARRVGRGRAAGAAQDPRGHGGQRAAAGRPQAPAPGVRPRRHDEHPVHLRRRVRRARARSSSSGSGARRWGSRPRSEARREKSTCSSCSPSASPPT